MSATTIIIFFFFFFFFLFFFSRARSAHAMHHSGHTPTPAHLSSTMSTTSRQHQPYFPRPRTHASPSPDYTPLHRHAMHAPTTSKPDHHHLLLLLTCACITHACMQPAPNITSFFFFFYFFFTVTVSSLPVCMHTPSRAPTNSIDSSPACTACLDHRSTFLLLLRKHLAKNSPIKTLPPPTPSHNPTTRRLLHPD